MSKYQIILEKKYVKDLKHVDIRFHEAITDAVRKLSDNPRPHGAIKLKGYDDLYRIRIADYRVIYSIVDKKLVILVLELADRKDAYKKR